MKSFILKSVVLISFLLLNCSFALAAASGASGEHHAPGLGSLVWPTINFLLYLGVIYYLYKRLGKPALISRSAQVKNLLESSANSLASALGELQTAKKRQEDIGVEKEQIIEGLRVEGESISQAIIEEAHLSAEKIQNDCQRRIAGDISKARSEIRAAVVSRASSLARQSLEAELSAEDDLNLRKAAISSVLR